MVYNALIIDDDLEICELVQSLLKKEDLSAVAAYSAEEGLAELRKAQFDIIILDWGLPGLSGIKACELIKEDPKTAHIPIIMLTAESAERAKVQGLRTGADDYVTKPLSPAEFTARVHALLRRSKFSGAPQRILQAPGLRVDLDAYQVTVKGKPAALRPKEFQILVLLLENKGRAISRDRILVTLWDDAVVTEHTLEVHINNLRDKLGPLSHFIKTIPGRGYKFEE